MNLLKAAIKRTPVYEAVLRARARKALRAWSSEDEEMRRFYGRFMTADDVVFDVGANTGNRVKVFARLARRVIAIEPQQSCLAVIQPVYERDPRVTIVPKAVGEAEGTTTMLISNATTISSLSQDWIRSVQASGRFAEYRWDKTQTVQLTTLDRLIDEFGTPAFIKIDIEGFEYQALRGLSRPVQSLSFEFTPEFIDATYRCLDHLSSLGDIRCNYSLGESFALALDEWVSAPALKETLARITDTRTFGDVYVSFR